MDSHAEEFNKILEELAVADEKSAEYFRELPPITPSRKEVISIIKNFSCVWCSIRDFTKTVSGPPPVMKH